MRRGMGVQMDYKKMGRKAGIVWRIDGVLSSLIWIIVGFVVSRFVSERWDMLVVALVFITSILSILIHPSIEIKQWRYSITEERIDLIQGIYWTSHVVVPVKKIQYLKITQGLIQKRFGLSTIHIVTAGNEVEIPNIEMEESEQIVENLRIIIERMEDHGKNL